jgi:uncharacterized membrane protein AbrB (regulator of aidB expression)
MENKNKYMGLIFGAVIVEGIITYARNFYTGGVFSWSLLASVVLGIAVAVVYKLDLLKDFNLTTKVPYVSNILTGILISRGSNYIYDLIGKFTELS